MSSTNLNKLSGLAALLGGLAWAAWGGLLALRPAGVPGRPHRDGDGLEIYLVTGVVLITVGLVGFYFRQARRFEGRGKVPFVIGIAGSLIMVGGWGLTFASEQFWMVGMLGYFALFIGMLLAGLRLLVGTDSTRWTGALLIAASLALITFNTEDWRAWLAVPFGLAWVLLGYTLWSDQARTLQARLNPA